MCDVLIIGGGITGLAAAYRLEQEAPTLQITLVERDAQLGGKILTTHEDGFVIEGGPDCFLSRKPRGLGLCEELGVLDALQGRQPEYAKTFVRRHGVLHRLPEGLTGMIPTNLDALANNTLISEVGQARLAEEATLPPAPENEGDESIANFITRRLGLEVYEQLVEPLMGGIYAGDATQLSLAATFPQLRQLELKHGSLLNGLLTSQRAAASGNDQTPAHPPFVAFRNGMGELVEALVAHLKKTTILSEQAVTALTRQVSGKGYQVLLESEQTIGADAVIITTPAFVTAKLLDELAPDVAGAHAGIPYGSSVTVSLAFPHAEIAADLDGYGYVIPRVEDTDLLACTWTSRKWAGRAPEGMLLVRVFLGRFGRRDMTEASDEELIELARAELLNTLDIDTTPTKQWVYRCPRGMPQYVMGHTERLATIEEGLRHQPGLYVAGAAYRGVGIPDCIHSGEEAAMAVKDYLLH